MTRRSSLVVLLGVLAAVLMAMGPSDAAQSGTIGIRPEGVDDWLEVEILPGEAAEVTAVVTNKAAEPAPVLIYAVDATTTPQGDFALAGIDDPREGVGAWLEMPVEERVLAPRSTQKITAKIQVPLTASPGDYAGGIVVERLPEATPKPDDSAGDVAVQVNVVERVGLRTFVRVAGTATSALEAGALHRESSDGRPVFSLQVKNTGNLRTAPAVVMTVSGFRVSRTELDLTGPKELLPGATATYSAAWTGSPSLARVVARAQVSAEGVEPFEVSTSYWIVPVWGTVLSVFVALVLVVVGRRAWRWIASARAALNRV